VARCLGKSWIIPGRRKRRTLRRAGFCFHDEGVATAFPASRLSRRGLGEGGSDALGVVSRRGDGDGISGLAPVTPRAKEEATRWVLFSRRGDGTAFPASRLSRRGLGGGGTDSTSGFGHLLPKWRSVSQIPNSRPPTHPQFRYRASFFSLTSKLNHWSRALIHFLVAAPPGRGHSAD